MGKTAFTNSHDPMAALAASMTSVSPVVENHHEQVAYLAYHLSRELGLTGFERDFQELAGPLCAQARIAQMRDYPQHGSVSTYDHVLRVARTALRWARALHLRTSEPELVRGALLHDYYLYDWHDPTAAGPGHATRHPLHALRNAEEDFDLTERERNIIASHMWPIPPTRVPASREAWLVCLADTWCSLVETLFMR